MSAPTILPRSEWTDTPGDAFGNVRPDRTITPAEVEWLALHWPGDGGRNYNDLTKEQCAEKIRSYHRFHTTDRGWADIGYPFIADMAGRIWTGAGTRFASAHSGSTAYPRANWEGLAVLLLIGENEKPSAAMVASVNNLIAWLRGTFPNMTVTLGHQQVRGASTQCPGPHVMAALAQFDGKTSTTPPPKEPPVSRPTFVSPAQGRVSSEWGSRRHPITGAQGFHRGIDIANSTGTPVYAAYGGKVVQANTGTGNNPLTGGWNTGRSIIIEGPGGGNEFYGHLNTVGVRVGQTVRAGDQIGTMGATGNVTGPHLHFETWNGRTQGGGASGAGNTRNPRTDFAKHGIAPGSKPVFTSTPTTGGGGGSSKPAPKPAQRRNGPGATRTVARRKQIQRYLARLGVYSGPIDGDYGPATVTAVRAYQSRQQYRPQLTVDGDWGNFTQAHYDWVRTLQVALNRWAAVAPKLARDHDLGPNTIRGVRQFQQRNQGGAYRGAVDGIPGPVTCSALKIKRHPGA